MKERTTPCIYYTCAHADCQKSVKDVTIQKCQHCTKYRPRKTTKKPESIKSKRFKDKDRHDNWKDSRNW